MLRPPARPARVRPAMTQFAATSRVYAPALRMPERRRKGDAMWASLVLTFAILADGKGGETTRVAPLRASQAVTDEAPGLFTRGTFDGTIHDRAHPGRLRPVTRISRSRRRSSTVERHRVRAASLLRRRANSIVSRVRERFTPRAAHPNQRGHAHVARCVDCHRGTHELQHAVEIAEHLEVIDGTGALELYRYIAVGRCRGRAVGRVRDGARACHREKGARGTVARPDAKVWVYKEL